jgi:hypothetical protein
MVPAVSTVLNGIARAMLMDMLPQASDAYAAQSLQLDAALLMCCAQEFDRAAARLVEENTALVELFTAAAAVVEDPALRDALRARAADDRSDLLVSALHARNRVLRALLIDLQAHVEQLAGAAAQAIDERIWAELAASTRRRQLDLAMPS